MLREQHLIPFKTSDLPDGPYLIFSPHPDDETFAMGGTLLLAAKQGIKLHIVFITNGDLGGDPDVRQQEAKSVCEKLGASYEYLNYKDRAVCADHSGFNEIKDLLIKYQPESVFFPSPLEYHVDHRATSALVWRALQISGYRNSAYTYEVSKPSDCNILIDITDVANAKRELCNLYQSQVVQNNYVDITLAINKLRTYTLSADVEYAEAFNKIQINILPKQYFKRGFDDAFVNILPYEKPIISILIRTYNRRALLARCLDSLVKQAYSERLDIVVVNDGGESVDDILVGYNKYFHRVKVVNSPENRGRSASANTALINAKGQFFNFLDDDDTLDPNHIQVFLNRWWRDNTIKALYRGVRVINDQGDQLHTYNESFDIGRMMHANFIPIHAVTFSREFFDLGIRFDESLQYMEDWDFWIQLSRLTKFHHVPQITATYHMVGSSAASPHMQDVFDAENHMQKVREKWQPKWTPVENARIFRFFKNQQEQIFNKRLLALTKKVDQ